MSNLYFFNDAEREKLLNGICDQCVYCYRGLDEDVFELVCSECMPVKFLSGLEPVDKDLLMSFVSFIAYKRTMAEYRQKEGEKNE